jgi:hypothetical protein
MDKAALDLLRQLGDEGPKHFSAWDAPRFAAYCRNFLPAVWQRLPAGSRRSFASLAAMVQHGIGAGYLKGNPDAAPQNFLEFCIREWLPQALSGLPPEEHLPLLAQVWNLGEGLLSEPEWVNRYVLSRIGELNGKTRPEAFLVAVLRPLLEPAPAARWEAPYRVTLLALRAADDEFLPGEMHLAAPAVLVVSDRRRPVRLGIHLRRGGQSTVLGTFATTSRFPDEPAAVAVRWDRRIARIGESTVRLPFLAGPYRWAAVPSGYLVASAVDSQKLWIVESAA